MGIGTSRGAFYDSDGHFQASMHDRKYDTNDDMVLTPNEVEINKGLYQSEMDNLGIEVKNTKDKMPFPDNRNPDSDFNSRFGNLPPSGILNDLKKPTGETVPLVRKISDNVGEQERQRIVQELKDPAEIDKALDIGMAFSGGGLTVGKFPKGYHEIVPIERRMMRSGTEPSHPGYRWDVIDKHTGKVVRKDVMTRTGANRTVDNMDNKYGGYRYKTEPRQIESSAYTQGEKEFIESNKIDFKGALVLGAVGETDTTPNVGEQERQRIIRELKDPKEVDKALDIGLAFTGGGLHTAGEKVGRAALKFGDEIFTGVNHGDALDKILAKGIDFDYKKILDGFITTHGRFVSRAEALDIAEQAKQVYKKHEKIPGFELSSEELLRGR